MLKEFLTLLRPPVFSDEDKTRQARYSHTITLAFLGLILAFEIFVRVFAGYSQFSWFDLILTGVAALSLVGLHLLKKGYIRLTSFLLVALVWLASNGIALSEYGAQDASYLVNFAIVLMAGLLLGWKASVVVTAMSILSGIGLAYAEVNGLIAAEEYPVTAFVRDISFVFGLNGILMLLLIRGLESALRKSRMSFNQLETANMSLSETQGELEQRSSELLQANRLLEKRTKRLQAIALVARTAASAPSFEMLVASLPGAISKQLGYQHVRLYLLDERKEFVILKSASLNPAGRAPGLESRTPVRQSGLIGFTLQTGQPRVVRSGERDESLAAIPELADGHTRLLLPLKAGEQMLGVLDIYSGDPEDLTEDDVSVLAVLADQLAITLQNLLLYEQSQRALRRADSSAMRTAGEAWRGYKRAIEMKGYRYDGIKSEPMKATQRTGNGRDALAVPIELRGQQIGAFRLNPSDPARAWTDDEIAMIRATADRVALALEGARLLEEAQKRATREAFLSDISTRLSASFQLDSILRDTVRELGETLRGSTVTFQLVNPADLPPPEQDVAQRANSGGNDE
ncbi:MAG: GAF domain-containing protein [Chloroflexota bacterium]|nr:GAF domain-containing protein [Chloroflexota bacterium]